MGIKLELANGWNPEETERLGRLIQELSQRLGLSQNQHHQWMQSRQLSLQYQANQAFQNQQQASHQMQLQNAAQALRSRQQAFYQQQTYAKSVFTQPSKRGYGILGNLGGSLGGFK